MSDQCYYDDPNTCEGELWECLTCGVSFCQAHFHTTSKGENVECVGCERERLEAERIRERLEYLRGEIEAECISYEELAELQGLAEHIEDGDVLLLEWAGVPEEQAREEGRI